jgi:hypothetical protein
MKGALAQTTYTYFKMRILVAKYTVSTDFKVPPHIPLLSVEENPGCVIGEKVPWSWWVKYDTLYYYDNNYQLCELDAMQLACDSDFKYPDEEEFDDDPDLDDDDVDDYVERPFCESCRLEAEYYCDNCRVYECCDCHSLCKCGNRKLVPDNWKEIILNELLEQIKEMRKEEPAPVPVKQKKKPKLAPVAN